MVEVVYQPWRKIVIHEMVKYGLDDLVKLQALGVELGGLAEPLLWTEGIAFSKSTMHETQDVIKEKLEGVAHWSSVEWAHMPEFKDVIVAEETKVKVPIIDVSSHPIYQAVSKWLKKQEKLESK